MSGSSQTYTYTFNDASGQVDTVVVTFDPTATPTDTTGSGPSVAVDAIGGSLGANDVITGEVGTGGAVQTDGNSTFDNALFTTADGGVGGNQYELDTDGLQFTDGGTDYNLYSNGDGTYELAKSDGTQFTQLTLVSTDAPCFVAGTRIATATGEAAVESIAIGDVVRTAGGALRPVKWVGQRSYDGRFLARNPRLYPIRFAAGSLGGGLPRRDLLVSVDHAMHLDGVLVPAHCLVNGRTIVQDREVTQVAYYHVELESHDVLLAEGAPSESFLDDDNRQRFHNAGEFAARYPGLVDEPAACAPRVTGGHALAAIQRRLAAEAGDDGLRAA